MSVDLRATVHPDISKSNNDLVLNRTMVGGDSDKGNVAVNIVGPNGQTLTTVVGAVDLLNGLKAIFPELLITLPG